MIVAVGPLLVSTLLALSLSLLTVASLSLLPLVATSSGLAHAGPPQERERAFGVRDFHGASMQA